MLAGKQVSLKLAFFHIVREIFLLFSLRCEEMAASAWMRLVCDVITDVGFSHAEMYDGRSSHMMQMLLFMLIVGKLYAGVMGRMCR